MTIDLVSIDSIRPADYNPRRIDEEQFQALQSSLKEVGFVIPVLVNRANGVIIAGHQRTKAARAIGITEVPAIRIENCAYGDEIKFNQMHNGVDQQQGYSAAVSPDAALRMREFQDVPARAFSVEKFGPEYVKEICRLILKYGNVFSCVVCGGDVLVGVNYIRACQLLNMSVTTYALPKELHGTAKAFLEGKYGTYCYDDIKRNTFVQGLAQLNRSVQAKEGKDTRANHSMLYTNLVIPYLSRKPSVQTILDFGCGKGAYIQHLAKRYTALGVEFYNNNGHSIDVTKGHQQIDRLIQYLSNAPRFDVVVCDSVLNSVDSVKAEKSVVTCCNLFCSDKLFISGRPYDEQVKKTEASQSKNIRRRLIEFYDENKFTALYRKGNWYFQHYHSREDVEKLMHECGFKIDRLTWAKYGSSWQVEATKVRDLSRQEYIDAIDFEFNLPLPDGKSYQRHEEVKAVLHL